MVLSHLCYSRKFQAFLLLVFCLSSPVQGQRSRQESKNLSQQKLSSQEVIQRVSKSLVSIVTQDKEGQPIAQASGFFFKDGLVATNLHVFKRASQGYVKLLNSGMTYKIDKIAGINRKRDLCILRINGASASPLPINTSGRISVGDDIYTAGNPIGLEGTFSKGIISSIRSDQGLIQIDAAVSPGSSGGPVVNNRAEVIGIVVSSLIDGQNLNFAVPVMYLQSTPQDKNGNIEIAGALSLTDRDKDKLKGPVRLVVTRRTTFEYNQQTGQYIEGYNYNQQTSQFIKGPPELSTSVSYNYEGQEIETTYYDPSMFMRKIEHEYDEEGFRTRSITTNQKGKRNERIFTKLESLNQEFNNRQFSTTSKIEFTDAKGNTVTGVTQTYDRDGNEIETIYPFKGERFVRRFDGNGNQIEETKYMNGELESIDRFTYEFDQYGNWTRQLTTSYLAKYSEVGFTPMYVQYREIAYYGK